MSRTMRGIVRWYSHQGYGFIDPTPSVDGKALYFHISDVKDRSILQAGDAVTFDVIQVPKGLKAVKVVPATDAPAIETKEIPPCTQQAV
jgi:cold shock CspA family protein